ncbi:hypothetical protein RJ55_05622 [Drechmeria coniospora]|nr:hypothetical protein RJ55_05622 [Drechmeria coniospora]
MSLANLPPELCVSVLKRLCLADLRSVAVVSRPLALLAEPLLYAAVEVAWSGREAAPLASLLRSLVREPERRGHVRSLRLVGNVEDEFEADELPELDAAAFPVAGMAAFVRSTTVPHADRWVDELRSGSVDAVVAVLVAMLPNLAELHLGANFTVDNGLLGEMLRRAVCEPSEHPRLPTFAALGRVDFSRRADECYRREASNSADVLPLFYLPNVRHLAVSVDNPSEFAWPVSAPPTPSSVTELELRRLRESRLRPLLAVLVHLRRLHWHWYYQEDLDEPVSAPVVELDTIAAALSAVRETLTHLTIRADTCPAFSYGAYDPPRLRTRASLDGLAELGILTSLCIPWAFVAGFSKHAAKPLDRALPPNLEMLALTSDLCHHDEWHWDDGSIVLAVQRALESRPEPPRTKLRTVVLPLPVGHGELAAEWMRALARIGADAGVDLRWPSS